MRVNLRAFAIGILFATGVMGVAYSIVSTSATTLNEENVATYVEENGLHLLSKEEYNKLLPSIEPEENQENEQADKDQDSDKDSSAEADEKEEVNKEEVNKEEEANKPFEIVIPDGLATYEITALLSEKGIIEDDKKFDAYLEEKGIATKVRSGTFTMKKGMSYPEAADVLIK
ncbi:endolytic transglycosylase MltG [Sutcliffiella rhizosphaerae]|uniref:Endolytic transglycosylase MltG n=1 Tax=Sutcliffiella rhizosphaerae TaxID=2880967 RepID=A0ABN8A6F0_9BACI|nr:endolytic transglycosylase MltG [Sutcliffiella rhizosphaerae]CAG9619311.1 hypothetical protein BACCIP111883_00078 [Sutcliffiella rhizosphaerae]